MELWKPIPSLDARYEASSEGRIRRATPANATKVGRVRSLFPGGGYLRCSFYEDGKVHCLSVHRLIYEAFYGPIPSDLQINHINGEKLDNRLENLELCTQSENMIHAYRVLGVGVKKKPPPPKIEVPRRGELNPNSKLRETDLPAIAAMRAAGHSQSEIAKAFGVHQTTIGKLLAGKIWPPITHLRRRP